jgi:hypothetical protein
MDSANNPTIETLRSEPLFVLDLLVGYERALHFEDAPAGGRSLFPVDGGHFEGDRLRGRVESGGVDWVQWRSDGAMLIDVRLMLRTDDDALIAMSYVGLSYAEPEIMELFKRREPLEFRDVYARTTPRFETGDSRYSWLNRVIAVANGMRRAGQGPVYHVFAIT